MKAQYHAVLANSNMIDFCKIRKGILFPDLPETYVIFITEHDIWKRGKPLYKMRRTFEDTEEVFNDGAHILYVNGKYQSESPLGRLMHDFFCSDPNDMYSDVLAERVRFFKEDEKGVAAMCKVMEEIHNDGISIGETRGAETERLKNIKSLIASLGITAEAAMDALKIAKSDQPKYLALL